uniref:Uncharacterized protein n=1 Tax=Rhizophora mucronata TaxID=61149 RepID=A0A2P2NWV3_RHIMU
MHAHDATAIRQGKHNLGDCLTRDCAAEDFAELGSTASGSEHFLTKDIELKEGSEYPE